MPFASENELCGSVPNCWLFAMRFNASFLNGGDRMVMLQMIQRFGCVVDKAFDGKK